MKLTRRSRSWADSARPFGRKKTTLPVLGVNWKGQVYAMSEPRNEEIKFPETIYAGHDGGHLFTDDDLNNIVESGEEGVPVAIYKLERVAKASNKIVLE